MIILNPKTFEKARLEIKKAKQEKQQIAIVSSDDELTRKILEKEEYIILTPILSEKKDKLYQRSSGLNHVLAKIAKYNNNIIGIFLDELLENSDKKLAQILARLQQNIQICKKKKVSMQWITTNKEYHRDIHELYSLGIVLGMDTKMAKTAYLHQL
jgi:RNase P/RNase MRP subunit p30